MKNLIGLLAALSITLTSALVAPTAAHATATDGAITGGTVSGVVILIMVKFDGSVLVNLYDKAPAAGGVPRTVCSNGAPGYTIHKDLLSRKDALSLLTSAYLSGRTVATEGQLVGGICYLKTAGLYN